MPFCCYNGSLWLQGSYRYLTHLLTILWPLNLLPDDELISTRITDGTMNVFLGSLMGKAIRFHESDIRASGRTSMGVRGMNLSSGDQIVAMEVLSYGQTLFAVTENGYGKRTSFDEYRTQSRGGKGIISIQTTDRNGKVVSAHAVTDKHRLMLISEGGQMILIGASDLRIIGRNTQGVRLFNLKEGDKLVSAALLEPEEDAPAAETPDVASDEETAE